MKKAQVQFMEMIFVLLILIIVIFVSIIVYYSFYSRSLTGRGSELEELDAALLSNSISGLPEITCGISCIDAIKIIAFQETQKLNPSYYREIFRNRQDSAINISIKIVYPQLDQQECTRSTLNQDNFPGNCDYFIIYEPNREFSTKKLFKTPVSVYFPSTEKYAIGLMNIEVLSDEKSTN